MQSSSLVFKSLSLAVMLCAARLAHADVTVFTDEAAYLAAVGDTGTDKFDNFTTNAPEGPLQREAGEYGYTVATAGLDSSPYLYVSPSEDGWLSTQRPADYLVFSHFSSKVRGVGGLFFNTDFFGDYADGADLTLTATEQTGNTVSYTFTPTSSASFLGFVATGALSEITVHTPGDNFLYPTVNNLHLSVAAVPEPASYAMLLAGLAMVGAIARRRALDRSAQSRGRGAPIQ
ncbi:MAG: PEPxxWA-CTERM sorting domain-containing protein [Pseudomonadota bacterium]